MVDYALMNQYLYEGNAAEVEKMTRDSLLEGRSAQAAFEWMFELMMNGTPPANEAAVA